MWLFDVVLTINALFNIVMHCKHDNFSDLPKVKNSVVLLVIILKIVSQIMICLKLEYKLNLTLYHVLIPFWLLLPVVIIDISLTLFKRSYVI